MSKQLFDALLSLYNAESASAEQLADAYSLLCAHAEVQAYAFTHIYLHYSPPGCCGAGSLYFYLLDDTHDEDNPLARFEINQADFTLANVDPEIW